MIFNKERPRDSSSQTIPAPASQATQSTIKDPSSQPTQGNTVDSATIEVSARTLHGQCNRGQHKQKVREFEETDSLLNIEDILPFFPDNKQTKQLKQEMNDAFCRR